VIGWVHVYVDKLLTVGPRAEIGGLVVDEGWRSRGVGAALMQRAERWARQKGCSRVVVRSNVLRSGAHVFYERCGYQLFKQQKVYSKDSTV
jgi:GNAT superfamily N-acetyltransferase